MPYVIKQLDNVVNIIVEGSTDYLTALSTDSVAQLRRKTPPLDDQIYFTSNTGFETATIAFDGTIKYQDNGGAATTWAGTIEDLVDKLNTEYFVKAGAGGGTTELQGINNKLEKKEIGKIIPLSADDSGGWSGYGFTFMQPSVIFNLDVGAAQSFDSTRTIEDAAGLVAELNSLQNLYFFEVIDENNLAISAGTETVENLVSLTLDTDFDIFVYTIPYADTTDQELSNLDAIYQLQKKMSKVLDFISLSTDATLGAIYPINEAIPTSVSSIIVRPINYEYEVAKGFVSEATTVNKFGYNQDIDTASPEVVAAFGGSVNIMTTADTLDIVSSSANDATGGTGASFIQISGIGADNLSQTELITINGTTPVTTVNTWLGVNRMFVLTSGTLETNDGDITATDTLGTVGIQAQIPASGSVTQQCIFHTQIGYTFLIDFILLNCIKISGGGGNPEVTFKVWSYSRVTNTRYEVLRQVIDTQRCNSTPINLSQPLHTGGREVIYITAETDVNNTACNARFSGIESLST